MRQMTLWDKPPGPFATGWAKWRAGIAREVEELAPLVSDRPDLARLLEHARFEATIVWTNQVWVGVRRDLDFIKKELGL